MKSIKFTLMVLGIVVSCFTFSETAQAEGARSYVSPSGSDNRPCTRTQPCRTFDGAMAKTDEGGEIVALETGTYEPATVNKSMTLTAAPGADVMIKATSGNAVTIIPATGTTVVLRGLKMSGPGRDTASNGVEIGDGQALAVYVENCLISDFGTGIIAMLQSGQLIIADSVLRNNTNGLTARIFGGDSNGTVVSRTRFERNSVGVNALNGNSVSVKESIASGNGVGFLAEAHGRISLFNSMATRNSTGVKAAVNGLVTIGYSIVTGNNTGLVANGTIRTLGNNMVTGNDLEVAGSINVSPLTPW